MSESRRNLKYTDFEYKPGNNRKKTKTFIIENSFVTLSAVCDGV